VAEYRKPCGTKPCDQCPFRRDAAAGWLGEATPESFIVEISMEHPLPCHPTIDYSDPKWKEKWEAGETGRICAGSLIMSANMCKIPRDRAFPKLPSDLKAVFGNHKEFLDYHNNANVRSWESDRSYEVRTKGRKH
jgi:hypothetical protein